MLLRSGEILPLTPKVFDLLALLVERSGHLIEREELLTAVWADSFVEEANLTVSISALRKALGEQADGRQYVETVPKRGYRFVADLKVVGDDREQLVFHEHTRAQVIIEQEDDSDEQDRVKSKIGIQTRGRAKLKASKRLRLQTLIVSVAIVVSMSAVGYLWKSRARQPAAEIRSIAVLPFKQLGEGEKDELVGFGIADVLITRLGSLNRIAVRPTSAVFKYLGTEPDILSVGRDLKVDAVLEGNIQRIGDRIRVTARLVRVRDGELLWADTFDGRPNEPFELQDRMSEQVAAGLFLNPADEEKKLLAKRDTKSAEAYQAYTRGRYFWNKRTTDGLKKAIEYFEFAIEKDANYALAFAGLADGYSLLVNYTRIAPKEGFPKAKEAATQALRIDDTVAEAHASLGKIHHLYDWDWEAAEREFKRAIELNPDYATAHQWYGEYLISMGRFDEAKAEMKQALELDPVSIAINIAQGFPYYNNREYDEAIAAYKKALALDQKYETTHWRLNQVYIQKRMYDEASAELLAWADDSPQVQENLKTITAASGIRGYWELSVARSEAELDRCCSRDIAVIYAYLGNRENVLKWLEKAYRERSHMMVDLKVDPAWDDLRSDPRFADLLRRMRLADCFELQIECTRLGAPRPRAAAQLEGATNQPKRLSVARGGAHSLAWTATASSVCGVKML